MLLLWGMLLQMLRVLFTCAVAVVADAVYADAACAVDAAPAFNALTTQILKPYYKALTL